MCGRYTIRGAGVIRAVLRHEPGPGFEEFSELRLVPRFNIAPSQDVPIVRTDQNGEPLAEMARWGLIPSWTKGKPKLAPINARAETLATSGMFRGAYEKRRCLVPADGFYEWRKTGRAKQPMFIRRKANKPFAFAGLWESWRPEPDAEPVITMTIITTAPNDLMSPIHNRMPVILDEAEYDRWLDRATPPADLASLLKPHAVADFEALPVSTHVNSPRNDGPDCIAGITDEPSPGES